VFSPGFLKPVIPLTADDLFYRSMGVEAVNGKPATMRDAEILGEDAERKYLLGRYGRFVLLRKDSPPSI
jgi:hypothetical protein